jgi:hypothetical protein
MELFQAVFDGIKLRIPSAKKIQIIKCYMFEGLNCHLLIFEFLAIGTLMELLQAVFGWIE